MRECSYCDLPSLTGDHLATEPGPLPDTHGTDKETLLSTLVQQINHRSTGRRRTGSFLLLYIQSATPSDDLRMRR
ncbi:hypothetical protein ccbrp13_65830 [Ktedonobacteria bacterium brp13]|nr:hypothetical protein ccbrp13_65830 [Ktedonobacteria bacterium brp13]